jgi:hypothetical protein
VLSADRRAAGRKMALRAATDQETFFLDRNLTARLGAFDYFEDYIH